MRRSLKLMLLFMSVFMLTGCKKDTTALEMTESNTSIEQTSVKTDETTTAMTIKPSGTVIPENERGYGAIKYRTYADEDMKRLGVDKKLVVACGWEAATIPETVTAKFNELLVNKYGCDFVVEFIGFNDFAINMDYFYGEALDDMKAMGQQVDIIVSGGDRESNYTSLVDKGMLVELTDILETTEEGRIISSAMPEKLMKVVERDKRVYGICQNEYICGQYAIVCNKELADSFGLEVEEGFSFEDIGIMLGSISDKLEEKGIIGIYSSAPNFEINLGYVNMLDLLGWNYDICAKQNEEGQWTAFNPLCDEEYVELLHTIRQYGEKGWLVTSTNTNKVLAKKIENGDFLFYAGTVNTSTSGRQVVESSIYLTETGRTAEVIVGQIYNTHMDCKEGGVTGIASWSQHKDEALRLLKIFQTEEEIINLLIFGIENEHYVYENNEVILRNTNIYKNAMGLRNADMLNIMLTYPQYLEPDDKTGFYEAVLNTSEEGPLLKYGITYVEYAKILEDYEELNLIHSKYVVSLQNGSCEDVDGTIAEIVKMQKKAGINEIINKLNKRFESGADISVQNN